MTCNQLKKKQNKTKTKNREKTREKTVERHICGSAVACAPMTL